MRRNARTLADLAGCLVERIVDFLSVDLADDVKGAI